MKTIRILILTLVVAAATIATAAAFDGQTWFLSQTQAGVAGNDASEYPDMDGIGRYTVFESDATNLVPNDTNGEKDVFLKDRVTGEITLVSRGLDGTPTNERSFGAYISDSGRYVTFSSQATNIVDTPIAETPQAYVFDRETGVVELVSTNLQGDVSNAGSVPYDISADGRYVLFASDGDNFGYTDTNEDSDIFLKDRQTGTVELISVATDAAAGELGSYFPTMSADARYVVFSSYASNLGPTDTTDQTDIYYRDRTTDVTTLVSISETNQQSEGYVNYATVTDDGRYVVFVASGNVLIPIGLPGNGYNVIMRDMETGDMYLVSGDIYDIPVSAGGSVPEIAGDGRWVVFDAFDNTLVIPDTNQADDVYLKDMETGVVQMVSVGPNGEAGDGMSRNAAISRDGSVIVYESFANNFADTDTDNTMDIFAGVSFVEPSAVSLGDLRIANNDNISLWVIAAGLLVFSGILCAKKMRTDK